MERRRRDFRRNHKRTETEEGKAPSRRNIRDFIHTASSFFLPPIREYIRRSRPRSSIGRSARRQILQAPQIAAHMWREERGEERKRRGRIDRSIEAGRGTPHMPHAANYSWKEGRTTCGFYGNRRYRCKKTERSPTVIGGGGGGSEIIIKSM